MSKVPPRRSASPIASSIVRSASSCDPIAAKPSARAAVYTLANEPFCSAASIGVAVRNGAQPSCGRPILTKSSPLNAMVGPLCVPSEHRLTSSERLPAQPERARQYPEV
jgi:hypothetical protein